MKGLDSVTIKNFQSHKLSELQFVAGVNVVIGPSDAGKSAIFRALNWTLTNRPLGDAFRSEWGGETRVEVQTEDDTIVTRVKGKNTNKYQIGDPTEPTDLKAFGSDPPEDIKQLLAMDEINIQSQTEPPFLLVSSPGEVAQILNKAASIDDIDLCTRNLKKSHDSLRRDIQSGERWLKEQQEQLEQYNNLPKLEKLVAHVENLEQERNNVSSQKAKLISLVQKIDNIEGALKQSENLKDVEKHYKQAEKIREEWNDFDTQQRQLNSLASNINQVSNRMERLDEQIQKQQAEYDELMPDQCPLCGSEVKK